MKDKIISFQSMQETLDEIQCPFMIKKTLSKLGIEGM